MGLFDLFLVASVPVSEVLLITALGSFLAFENVGILGENARKSLNNVVFYVFNPALVSSNLAQTVTFDNFIKLWFMPFNILITFLVGAAMGWILVKVTKAPRHLKGLILGSCAAGNLGNLPLIIIPAICKEKASPFGAPDVCRSYGLAYVSLSMEIGAIFLWSFVYNIVRVSSSQAAIKPIMEPLLPSEGCSTRDYDPFPSPSCNKISMTSRIKLHLVNFSERMNLKAVLAPSTTGAIVGFIIGMIPWVRSLLIGGTAPLRVIQNSASVLGDAAIPSVTLIMGGNLLKGLKGSGVQPAIVIGIIAVRYIFLPLLGILVVKSAIHFELVHSDPLYQFVLLLQFAVPPAMNIGTITQLFGAGQSECSVIMLWAYSLASVSLTLWSTFFMWLVA
ncbi:PIN-LIKES 1-like protein [Drosera capensis]